MSKDTQAKGNADTKAKGPEESGQINADTLEEAMAAQQEAVAQQNEQITSDGEAKIAETQAAYEAEVEAAATPPADEDEEAEPEPAPKGAKVVSTDLTT